jgi:hypothetical protein
MFAGARGRGATCSSGCLVSSAMAVMRKALEELEELVQNRSFCASAEQSRKVLQSGWDVC